MLDLEQVGTFLQHQQRKSFIKSEENEWIPQPAPRLYSAQQFANLREKSKI